jgi:hypothetical protein
MKRADSKDLSKDKVGKGKSVKTLSVFAFSAFFCGYSSSPSWQVFA